MQLVELKLMMFQLAQIRFWSAQMAFRFAQRSFQIVQMSGLVLPLQQRATVRCLGAWTGRCTLLPSISAPRLRIQGLLIVYVHALTGLDAACGRLD